MGLDSVKNYLEKAEFSRITLRSGGSGFVAGGASGYYIGSEATEYTEVISDAFPETAPLQPALKAGLLLYSTGRGSILFGNAATYVEERFVEDPDYIDFKEVYKSIRE